MVVTFLSWIWIGSSAYLCGSAYLAFLQRFGGVGSKDIFRRMISGLLFLTVYAEVFSLFAGVGLAANLFLLVADFIFLLLQRRRIVSDLKAFLSFAKANPLTDVLILGFSAVILLRSSMLMRNGDSYLYHAQAIHWISEFGAVPGLGNLQTRYAFNSAFLCLQALFSLPFITGGVSLHSVNGFIVLLMLIYSVSANKFRKTGHLHISDFTRLAMLFYCWRESSQISSPGTDIFAMSLAIYIICEWLSISEESEYSFYEYCFLCLFIVFDITLKLSSAMLIILSILPIIQLLRKKEWRIVGFYCLLGIVIITPFLIRNVILSGWLVYPVRLFDVFNFDWKIPKETLSAECLRTFESAKGTYGSADQSLRSWFPKWVADNGIFYVILILADIFSSVILLRQNTKNVMQKHGCSLLLITSTLVLCLLYWWFSAPAVRFGAPFMVLLPLMLIGSVTIKMTSSSHQKVINVCFSILFAISLIFIYKSDDPKKEHIIRPADYVNWTGTTTEFSGNTFYIPDRMNWISYYYFPSALNEDVFSHIEMRGNSLKDGFRPVKGVNLLF